MSPLKQTEYWEISYYNNRGHLIDSEDLYSVYEKLEKLMDLNSKNLTTAAEELLDYEAESRLPQIIASFRGHGASLSGFLDSHGYTGEDTPAAKAAFLKRKFKEAEIDQSRTRNILKWITEPNGFERDTGFLIAFALDLTIEETDDFFRTVLLDRSFDCHTIREAILRYPWKV